MTVPHTIRPVKDEDIAPLARLWLEGWRDAHLAHIPDELAAYRTLESFRNRLIGFGDRVRTAGPKGAPVGLCAITGDELDQLYVGASARGTGLAAALLADGEARLAENGVGRAHLLCLPENQRAARFYEKHGWTTPGPTMQTLFTEDGPYPLRLFRFEKSLL